MVVLRNDLEPIREACQPYKGVVKFVASCLGAELLDSEINGYWALPGHAGTHTDEYFLELGRLFGNVDSKEAAEKVMKELWERIQAG